MVVVVVVVPKSPLYHLPQRLDAVVQLGLHRSSVVSVTNRPRDRSHRRREVRGGARERTSERKSEREKEREECASVHTRKRKRKRRIKIIREKSASGEEKRGREREREQRLCYESSWSSQSSSSCRSVLPEQRKVLLPRLSASRVVSDRRTVGILSRVFSARLVCVGRARSGQSRSSGRDVRNKGRRQDLRARERGREQCGVTKPSVVLYIYGGRARYSRRHC